MILDLLEKFLVKIVSKIISNPYIKDALHTLATYIVDPDKQPVVLKVMFSQDNIMKVAQMCQGTITIVAGYLCGPCSVVAGQVFMKAVKWVLNNQQLKKGAIFLAQMWLSADSPEEFVKNLMACPDIAQVIERVQVIFRSRMVKNLGPLFHLILKNPILADNPALVKAMIKVMPPSMIRKYTNQLLDELPPYVADVLKEAIKELDMLVYDEYLKGYVDLDDEDDSNYLASEENLEMDHDSEITDMTFGESLLSEEHLDKTIEDILKNEDKDRSETEMENRGEKAVVFALDIPFPQTKQEETKVKEQITSDIASSLNIDSSLVKIKRIRPGSVIVDVEIQGPNAKEHSQNLSKQIEDKNSKLYKGKLTKSTVSKSDETPRMRHSINLMQKLPAADSTESASDETDNDKSTGGDSSFSEGGKYQEDENINQSKSDLKTNPESKRKSSSRDEEGTSLKNNKLPKAVPNKPNEEIYNSKNNSLTGSKPKSMSESPLDSKGESSINDSKQKIMNAYGGDTGDPSESPNTPSGVASSKNPTYAPFDEGGTSQNTNTQSGSDIPQDYKSYPKTPQQMNQVKKQLQDEASSEPPLLQQVPLSNYEKQNVDNQNNKFLDNMNDLIRTDPDLKKFRNNLNKIKYYDKFLKDNNLKPNELPSKSPREFSKLFKKIRRKKGNISYNKSNMESSPDPEKSIRFNNQDSLISDTSQGPEEPGQAGQAGQIGNMGRMADDQTNYNMSPQLPSTSNNIPAGCNMHYLSDVYFTDNNLKLSQTNNTNHTRCISQCCNNTDCTHYTWTNNNCQMYGGSNNNQFTRKNLPGSISGIKESSLKDSPLSRSNLCNQSKSTSGLPAEINNVPIPKKIDAEQIFPSGKKKITFCKPREQIVNRKYIDNSSCDPLGEDKPNCEQKCPNFTQLKLSCIPYKSKVEQYLKKKDIIGDNNFSCKDKNRLLNLNKNLKNENITPLPKFRKFTDQMPQLKKDLKKRKKKKCIEHFATKNNVNWLEIIIISILIILIIYGLYLCNKKN